MTPLTLLTKGHTIRGMSDRNCYKVMKNGVPRFEGKTMERAKPSHSVPPIVAHPAECVTGNVGQEKIAVTFEAAPTVEENLPVLKKDSASPATVEIPTAPAPMPTARRDSKAGIWRLLLERITGKRRVTKVTSVQTELALDRVAPLRNDLSDDDLEVRQPRAPKGFNPFATAQARRATLAEEAVSTH